MGIGRVIYTNEGCFAWTIDNFLSEVWNAYSYGLTSPSIWSLDVPCCLFVLLDRKTQMLQLSFKVGSRPNPPMMFVKLSMETGQKGKKETRCGKTDNQACFHVYAWMQWSEMMERRNEILRDGELTVYCELTRLGPEGSSSEQQEIGATSTVIGHTQRLMRNSVGWFVGDRQIPKEDEESVEDSDEEIPNPKSDRQIPKEDEESVEDSDEEIPNPKIVKKLLKDLQNLFSSGDDSDVTLEVQSEKFHVHRNILRARSPVFNAMFSHDMKESLDREVVIDDFNAATFSNFLSYLYTGSTANINDENVFELYTASDMYEVGELKEECTAYMKINISVDNFCDIIALALRHSEKDLIDLSTEFFCANAKVIAKTATWQTFLRKNWTVGNELFLKSLSREK